MSEFPVTAARGVEMLTYLPRYYLTSTVMRSLVQAEGAELDALGEAVLAVLDQCFVNTATWGLDTWEKELGLSVAPAQPDAERREKITSRLRGYGTATIALTKAVAESYDQGSIDVIEDFAGYTVTIKFVDTLGIPANIDDAKAALRAVVPAHLAIAFEYNYTTWDELDGFNRTWDAWDAENLTWDEIEKIA